METNTVQTVTLTNSIIGVGILSMPFCFQKCGVVLSIVLLLLSSYVTRLVCSYMVKSAIISRRKNFEQIAFYAFGSGGKLLVELCVVGYLLGTCIAYFVVVGDLGPQITAKILSVNESNSLRTWVMIVVTIVCIIPLGMLRNVDSLASVCTASLGFYLCLVLKVISESSVKLQHSGWFERLDLWNWGGILQCMPIFTMALSCQMQIFEVYATMPTTSLDKMSRVIRQSTNICTMIYVAIGFFGYVAFNGHRFSGNILVDFTPSFASDIIKMGFVLSVAFSFPLAIFPCRVSLYSLLYKRAADGHMYIPESKFRPLTIAIVVVALVFGLLIPSIEVVIGLVGSTIGVAICLIIPAACYMTICKTNISEKQIAQVMIAFGFIIMVLGTYANMQAIDRTPERKYEVTVAPVEKMVEKADSPVAGWKSLDDIKPQAQGPPVVLPVESVTEKIIPKIELSNDVNKDRRLEKPAVVGNAPKDEDKAPDVPLADAVEHPPKEPGRASINNEAILKEDREIAVEEKDKMEKEISELKNAKKVLEAEVENIKEELVKKNKETEQLVLKKLDAIVEKIAEQSAGKVSLEEAKQVRSEADPESKDVLPGADLNGKKGPEAVPDDPIVKMLKAGGNNKSIPVAPLEEKRVSNDTVDVFRPAGVPLSDVDRIPAEGAGAGALPEVKRAEEVPQLQGIESPREGKPEPDLGKEAPPPRLIPPMYGALHKPDGDTKKDGTNAHPPVDTGDKVKENVPLPPLPVEVPADGKAEPRDEKPADNTVDVAPGGKRDLLAMRLKREANPAEPENCPKPNAPDGVENNLLASTKDPPPEKDGFR